MYTSFQQKFINLLVSLPDMRYVSAGMVMAIIFNIGMYGMLLNQTVVNVVERKEGEEKLAELDTQLSAYEFEYISKTSHVTLNDAIAMGYVEELSPLYVREGDLARLTYNIR